MHASANIAATLVDCAKNHPDQVAIRSGQTHFMGFTIRAAQECTYGQLNAWSTHIACALQGYGIGPHTHTAVMVRPSIVFFALMFGLFKSGAIPVLIDPGINPRVLRTCLRRADCQAFIGIPRAQYARWLLRWLPEVKKIVTVGGRYSYWGPTLHQLMLHYPPQHNILAKVKAEDTAAILFTSGSTGIPKGVVYRHSHFYAQITQLRDAFALTPGGIDLPTFPPFALFGPALGLTSILPDMDPRHPAKADPNKLHAAIALHGVTQMFGSPALMRVLAQDGRKLPTIERAISAGAPVPADTVTHLRALMPAHGQFWTPYGATECLPVSVIEGRELERTTEATQNGAGTCVGRILAANTVRIIAIDDKPLSSWEQVTELPQGQIGEITVTGPTTTESYYNQPQETAHAKIIEPRPDGTWRIVHRMGDVGYIDAEGRLWFCGRKSQRVITRKHVLYTEQIEPIFNTVPGIRRTALVGVGRNGYQRAVVCFETSLPLRKASTHALTQALHVKAHAYHIHTEIAVFLRHHHFPVDIRHNAKIQREVLARWAAKHPLITALAHPRNA